MVFRSADTVSRCLIDEMRSQRGNAQCGCIAWIVKLIDALQSYADSGLRAKHMPLYTGCSGCCFYDLHARAAKVSEVSGWVASWSLQVVLVKGREADGCRLARTCQAKSRERAAAAAIGTESSHAPGKVPSFVLLSRCAAAGRASGSKAKASSSPPPTTTTPPYPTPTTTSPPLPHLHLITPTHLLHRPQPSLYHRHLRPVATHPPPIPAHHTPHTLASHNPPWIGYRECLLLPKEWVAAEVLLSR
jgi:hypothetical protein